VVTIACRLPPFSRSRTHSRRFCVVDILDRHAERRADPGEGIDHQPDQRAVGKSSPRTSSGHTSERARDLYHVVTITRAVDKTAYSAWSGT